MKRLALMPVALGVAWLMATAILLLELFFGEGELPGPEPGTNGERDYPYDMIRGGSPDWWPGRRGGRG
jgi:hypothetical protein